MQMSQHNLAIKHITNKLFLVLVIILLQGLTNSAISQSVRANADTSIGSKIFLDDYESINRALNIKKAVFKKDPKNDLDYLIFCKGNAYLRLYLYPGNGCCQYFEVGYLQKQD